jgi:hypothetical protein
MVMSGNLGDTLNVMPLLSGIYKTTGHKVSLTVRDKMKMFNGFKEFMEMQDCIAALKFESEVVMDDTYQQLSLVDDFPVHPIRPWETVRLETHFKSHYNMEFEVDDDFVFNVPEVECPTDKFIVGDRMIHKDMDQRRAMGVLNESGKFPLDKCYFLDYNVPLATNAGYIKASPEPLITTFTGISVISDLIKKETIVLFDDQIANWDNKHISYSYNKHFYRDRMCDLIHINDFTIPT